MASLTANRVAPGSLAITEARVIDPGSGTIREDQTVFIEAGTIRAIEPGGAPGSAERVIRARGRTLLPGMIDAHVHLSSFAGARDEQLVGVTPETIASSTLRGVASGARLLACGITTARDCGCKHAGIFALRQAFASGRIPGPRIVLSGAGITMTGGCGAWSCAREADSPHEVRHLARAQLKAGADFVKLFVNGGVMHRSSAASGVQFTREELAAGIEEAHRVGKPAAVHAYERDAVELSVELGADSIEHGFEIAEAVAERMAQSNVFMVTTLWHYKRVALYGKDTGLDDLAIARAKEVLETHAESFLRAWRAGVPIAAGTDGCAPDHPAGTLPQEMAYMAELGMDAMDVLRSGTSEAARCLRIDGQVGRLEVGYVGDIAAFSEDPLLNIATLQDPWLVVKGGEVVLRAGD